MYNKKSDSVDYSIGVILIFALLFVVGCTELEEKQFRDKYEQEIRQELKEIVKEALIEAKNLNISSTEKLVTRIIDGDTFEIETGEKVRLIGIDAPEENEPFSEDAKSFLAKEILGKKVILQKDISDKDKYFRLLRYVYYNEELINLKLVEGGYAKAIEYPPDIRFSQIFNQAEDYAKSKSTGVWYKSTEIKNQKLSISTEDILDKCKCRKDCYGEKIYDYCLHQNVETPQQCKDLLGIHLGTSYDGSVKYYFDEQHLDTCYKSLISRQNDIRLCLDFPKDYSYMCFNSVGKKTLNPKHCKEIPYSFKSDCYLYISNNDTEFSLNLCDELNHNDRITCYSNKATINNDSSICLGLETKTDKNNCYSQIRKKFDYSEAYENYERTHYEPIYSNWFKTAKIDANVLDESYCEWEKATERGDHGGKNNSCYMSIAIYHKNLDECYRLPRDNLGIDLIRHCILYTTLLNDFGINDCDKLGVDFKECRDGVVLSKRNPELCKEVYDTDNERSYCVYQIATDYYRVNNIKNILFCKDAGSFKEKCIAEIYREDDEQFLKKEVCQILSESNSFLGFSGKCYHKFALKNLDLDSCEKIDDGFNQLKTDCKERVGHALNVK